MGKGEFEKRIKNKIKPTDTLMDTVLELIIADVEEAKKEFPKIHDINGEYDFGHAIKIDKWFTKWFGD